MSAFSTSLLGLGAAITFIIILSLGAQQRTRFRNKLRKKLSSIAFLENPNRLLSRLDNESDQDIAKTLQSVANNLSGFNADVIASAIKNAIAPIVSELQSLDKIDRLVDNTSGLSNLTPNAIASATTDRFTLLINPISEEIKHFS